MLKRQTTLQQHLSLASKRVRKFAVQKKLNSRQMTFLKTSLRIWGNEEMALNELKAYLSLTPVDRAKYSRLRTREKRLNFWSPGSHERQVLGGPSLDAIGKSRQRQVLREYKRGNIQPK